MGWKTIAGGIMGVGAWLLAQDPITVETIVQAIGMLLGVVGVRHAIAKSQKWR